MTRQHTIPQFYLKRFLSPGWVYRKGESIPKWKRSPKSVAAQPDYYGEDVGGKATLDDLNGWIESWGAPVFNKLIDEPGAIKESEWVILSWLFANLAVRTPVAIEGLRAMELLWTQQINSIAERIGRRRFKFTSQELSEESAPTTLNEINEYAKKLRTEGGHRTAACDNFAQIESIAKCIYRMSFLVLEVSSDLFFVSSDRPLMIESSQSGVPVGVGWGNPDAVGMIALDPSRFLFMFYHEPPSFTQVPTTPDQVELINLKTMNLAYKEIYSPSKYAEVDEWMKRIGRWARSSKDTQNSSNDSNTII